MSMFKELRDHAGVQASAVVCKPPRRRTREDAAELSSKVYLDLVKQFEDKTGGTLWAEVLRETFASVQRMLNSEVTMQELDGEDAPQESGRLAWALDPRPGSSDQAET